MQVWMYNCIRGNYYVIQNFTRFSKSNNDLQYHFVVFYYIIHFEMSISKSYAHFAQNYNIIHIFSTSALYHSCSRFGARHLHLPQHLSYSVVYIAPT
jgi:hypothetical protein